MDREKMCKLSVKAYMLIDYKHSRMELPIQCLLSAIDFDNEIMTICPLDKMYNQEDIIVSIKFCELSRKQLKAVK